MDSVTHAVSGALVALACPTRPRTAWAVPLAALASASPDIDVFFAASPLDFLLLHRGISHSLAALPITGLILALCMYPLWRKSTPGAWPLRKVFGLAVLLVLLHIWLDCVTTYGTMIFLPFSQYRVRLNGIFIVDILLLVPMLAGLWLGRKRPRLAALALLWALAYPALCVGLRMQHQQDVARQLEAQHIPAQHLTVLPDAFSPFFWRALYITDTPYAPPNTPQPAPDKADETPTALPASSFQYSAAPRSVHQLGLDWRGHPRTPTHAYPAAETALLDSLSTASHEAEAFFRFTLLPVQQSKASGQGKEYRFFDLRFSSALPLVERLMRLRGEGNIPFQLQARKGTQGWAAVRMVFSGAHREDPWHAPQPPHPPTAWQWLLGMH